MKKFTENLERKEKKIFFVLIIIQHLEKNVNKNKILLSVDV